MHKICVDHPSELEEATTSVAYFHTCLVIDNPCIDLLIHVDYHQNKKVFSGNKSYIQKKITRKQHCGRLIVVTVYYYYNKIIFLVQIKQLYNAKLEIFLFIQALTWPQVIPKLEIIYLKKQIINSILLLRHVMK
ncbi:hypothetical protein ACJX0J_013968, partial [Zea mays]